MQHITQTEWHSGRTLSTSVLFWSLLTFLIAILLFSGWAQAGSVRFKVGYPTEAHPPYYLGGGATVPADNPGYAVEILQEVGKKVKEVRFSLVRCQFDDCLQQIRSGKLDGLFNVPYREEWLFTGKYPFTKAKVDPRQKLYREEYFLYRVKDTQVSTDGRRIYGIRNQSVLLANNSAVADKLKEENYPLVRKANTTKALQALLQREAPAAVLVGTHVETLARQHGELADLIRRSHEPMLTEDYYLMLSRQFYAKKPWLAEIIWEEQTKFVNTIGPRLEEKYIK